MKRLFIVLLVALAAWLSIHKVAHAETNTDEAIFINYQKFHKKTISKTGSTNRAVSKTEETYSGRRYSKDEVVQLIIESSAAYRIKSDAPLCIAKLESGYNQFSKNPSSTASGVFQYLLSTWSQTDEGKAGLSVWDADANVKAAIKYMASRSNTNPWVVGSRCPPVIKTN